MNFDQQLQKLQFENEMNSKLILALLKKLNYDYHVDGETDDFKVILEDAGNK